MYPDSRKKTYEDLASILEIEPKELHKILYKIPENKKYRVFNIPKKTHGNRVISKPMQCIKELQKKMAEHLNEAYTAKACSYGFERTKDIKQNALRHLKSRAVLNIDLEDFFGSINFGRVFGLMKSEPFNFDSKSSAAIARLTTHENKLPQGAPSSPILSNMIARRLDGRLTKLASRNKLIYTRYVDDITFSTTCPDFNKAIVDHGFLNDVVLGHELLQAIEREGFSVNTDKSRKLNNMVRKDVTGIIINEFANVRRLYINSVFGMIYSWKKHGYDNAQKIYIEKYFNRGPKKKTNPGLYRSVIIGKISYIAFVRGWDDTVVHKLCVKYCEVDENPPKKIKILGDLKMKYDIFLGHASEEKESVAIPLYEKLVELKVRVFIDTVEIKWGDSLTRIINRALTESKYFLAIISVNSIKKSWPDSEMNSAIARVINGKQKILPLFVGTESEIETCKRHYSLISDRLYKEYKDNPEEIASEIMEMLNSQT